jgi:hypothetical protein
MKSAIRTVAIALATGGMFAASSANAVTKPSTIAAFTAEQPTQTLTTKVTSWRDPAFGDMGWTHSSGWGSFQAKKGQTVTIKAVAPNADLHPGITVWYRGPKDTAPDNYVADHFYPQNANLFVMGAKDESTGEAVGNIIMTVVKYGYDRDGNKKNVPGLGGKKDGVAGELELKFKVTKGGTYLFVLGGFNPGPGLVGSAERLGVETTVTVTSP